MKRMKWKEKQELKRIIMQAGYGKETLLCHCVLLS